MTIFCWPCYVAETARARDNEPPQALLQAVVIVDGQGLCSAHAAIRAEGGDAEANSPR
jgi:hypothetical protein